MKTTTGLSLLAALALAMAPACGKKHDEDKGGSTSKVTTGGGGAAAGGIKSDNGVDVDKKVLRIGTLDDVSGVAAPIGKPFANGKRLLAKVVNEGGSGLVPEGWTIELIERDHGYVPMNATREYKGIKDDVLFIGTSFGTVTTQPLQKQLKRDGIVAFPASLSSVMANHEHTPPLGPSYEMEALRAMDWAVSDAGDAGKVKAAIVYQKDDYGKDAYEGWKKAAEHHKVKIVAAHAVKPGESKFDVIVADLEKQGANYIMISIIPSSTGPLLGEAAKKMKTWAPKWVGNTPTWIDGFFSKKVQARLPPIVFANYYWVSGLPYWGEDVPGMKSFLAAYEKHKDAMGPPDFYIMASYVQGLIQMKAFSIALENKDVTRAGYMKALRSISDFTAGGMIQPVDLSQFPYVTSKRTRVLKPDFAKSSWTLVADYAEPAALGGK